MSKLSTLRPIYIQQKIIYTFPDAAELTDDKLQIYKNVASFYPDVTLMTI